MSAAETIPATLLGCGSTDVLENLLDEIETFANALHMGQLDVGTQGVLAQMLAARAAAARELYLERRTRETGSQFAPLPPASTAKTRKGGK